MEQDDCDEMANFKLRHHMKVQRWWFNYQSSVTSVKVSALSGDCAVLWSTVYECDLVICLCIFVPGAVWTRPYNSIDITRPCPCSEDLVGEGRYLSAFMYEAVSCNNNLKPLKVQCLALWCITTQPAWRDATGAAKSLRQHPGDSFIKASHAAVLCKFKAKGTTA